ncbi:MAG: hypothetical protein JO112_17575 [Planctomycetes bacterium]|nr:hypothetical protein [Planctomycetota bacterium]
MSRKHYTTAGSGLLTEPLGQNRPEQRKPGTPSPILVQVRKDLADGIELLLQEISRGCIVADRWETVFQALQALPWPKAEFGLALNRLTNARTYLEKGETGAADFELRLLRGLVQRMEGGE